MDELHVPILSDLDDQIPHFLNLDQKLNRIRVSKALLKRYEEEGDHFLDKIMRVGVIIMILRQNVHLWNGNEATLQDQKKKIRSQRSAGKILLTIFGDVDGPICPDFLSSRKRMNSDLYCDILVNKLKPGIRNKRRGKLSKGVLFLHDNARPHTSCKTVSTIIKLGFEVLEHPAYSPDLAPSDYFRFGLLKKELKVKRFYSDENVQKVVFTTGRKHRWISYTPGSTEPNNSLQFRHMSSGHTVNRLAYH
ncbi:hypothetical protein LAZ67_1006261 [Cordylochernes scorpioides]|uniref:Transposase n=1 Tax=Cordylochernes scorpioides TaxID=51811 RepID=A0ABY6JYY2_9ARAC|nr:hypothetical protein LAZ67_1006261 [Cordylochernes scorpioides]